MAMDRRIGVAATAAIYIILSSLVIANKGQRMPPPPPMNMPQKGPPISNPPPPPNPPPPQMVTNGSSMNPQQQMSMVQAMQQQKNEELSLVKDESIKRVLMELATVQTQSQMKDTLARVANLIGPLFYANFDQRKDQIVLHGRNASQFSQRLLMAVTDIQGEEVKALLLQKKLENLHAADFGFLPLAIQYALQAPVLSTLTGTKLASAVRANPGDTNLAYKTASALFNRPEQQMEYLQSLGSKIFPDVQRIIINLVLQWWGDANQWKDRELSLLTTSGDPLLSYLPLQVLESLDQDMADRFTSILGQANEIGKVWWMKPMSLKKGWFELAKGARYFGAVHEWSFRRMQKLSFLLEGASPEDLKLIPPIPEIKGLVIGNHYTELQCRVVFDAFYQKSPLSQEDLQEFQYHVLNLIPVQLQRFDLADSFSTLDEMMQLLEQQKNPSYATLLQISYFMWPLVNTSNGGLTIAPPALWQKRELSQMGKFVFLLPKSTLFQIPSDLINWDSNILQAIRSSHLSQPQIWHLTSLILSTIDDRFKPDYVFMIPSPFQQGIPASNISQIMLTSPVVRPEVLRAIIEESSGMLLSQQAVIFQRIRVKLGESSIIRNILNSAKPSELFRLFNPRTISKNMQTIIKTIMEMPETGRFGITSIQAKLLPRSLLSLWLNWVRENAQISRWTAEDILGRSALGAAHEINLAVLGVSCRDIEIIDPLDILTVILHYRHELYNLQRYEPELNFNVDLRTCLMGKLLEYLKLKSTLNGTQSDSHILTGLNDGEITAIGGEVLTVIPSIALQPVPLKTRMEILEEIGRVDMMDLFSMCPLKQLVWYGNTLLRDIHVSQAGNFKRFKKRQVVEEEIPEHTIIAEPNDEEFNSGELIPDDQSDNDRELNMNAQFFEKMGNLLCYASEIPNGNWSKRLFRDILESKLEPGSKTCCMHGHTRGKWFSLLQEAYGPDTTSWSEAELASIGDLLIVVPEQNLQQISLDSLSKAFNPIMKQSGFESPVQMPGANDKTSFIKSCVEQLATEGMQYLEAYKSLMRRYFQAAQWLVNTVKTTNELIKDGMGRSGRVPRWAEFKLVRRPRQIPIITQATASAPNNFNSQPQGSMLTFPQPMQPGAMASSSAAAFPQNPQQFAVPTINTGFPATPPQTFQPMPSPAPQFQQPQPSSYPSTNYPAAAQTSYYPAAQTYYPAAAATPTPAPAYPATYYPTAVPAYQDPSSSYAYNYEPAPLSPTQILGNPTPSQFQQPTPAANSPVPAYQQQYSQQYPAYQQQYPATQQQYPATQQQYPATQQQYSAIQQQYPATQQQYPITQQQFPATQQQFPATQQQFPATQQQFPATQQQFPATQQQFPATQQQFPATQQQFPATQQQFPATQQQFPATQQQFPATQQQFPATQQQFPATQQQFPAPPQQFQPIQQQFPVTQQQFPVTQQQFPAAQQQFPDTQQFSNTQQQFPPIQQQFAANQQQFPNQQFQNAQTVPQQQFGNIQQLSSTQQFGNAPQFPQGGQQFPNSQMGNIQSDGSSQNFGQIPGQGVPGFNFNPDGTFSTNANQPLAPRSLNADQPPGQGPPALNTNPNGTVPVKAINQPPFARSLDIDQPQVPQNASNSTTVNTEKPGSINFGNLQKAEAGQQPEITCHGIKAAGFSAIGLTIEDLQKLSAADLFNCLEHLGKVDWDESMKKEILLLISDKISLTTDKMDTATLLEMGSLVTAITMSTESTPNSTTPSEGSGINISQLDMTLPKSLDTLSILGSHTTDSTALQLLAEKFNADNKIFPGFAQGIARPDNLRIAVMALQNIICGFNDKIVNSIFETDASLFLDVSYILGRLNGCGQDVLTTLATHAVRASNYGPPRLWSQEDVETIGVVFAGLKPEAVSTVPTSSMQGLLPHAMRSLSPDIFKSFTADQLGKLSYSSASAISFAQMSVLTDSQRDAVNRVLVPQSSEFDIPVNIMDATLVSVNDPNPITQPENTTAEERDLESDGSKPAKGRSGEGDESSSAINATLPETTEPPIAEGDVATTTPPPPPTPSSADNPIKYRYKGMQITIICFLYFFSFFSSNQ